MASLPPKGKNAVVCVSVSEDISHLAGYVLSERHLQPLLSLVGRAAAKWRRIGVALMFSKDILDAIAATPGNASPVDCFTDLLSRWLKWAPPKHDLPTLQTLAVALREDTVGEERIANELMERFQREL